MGKLKIGTAVYQYGESPEESITLRGITPSDIRSVLLKNPISLDLLFNMGQNNGIEKAEDLADPEKVEAVAMKAAMEFPDLLAYVIALCANDEDSYEEYTGFTITQTLEALEKIGKLTFRDASNFGVFLGKVIGMAKTMKGALIGQSTIPNQTSPRVAQLQNGIEA